MPFRVERALSNNLLYNAQVMPAGIAELRFFEQSMASISSCMAIIFPVVNKEPSIKS